MNCASQPSTWVNSLAPPSRERVVVLVPDDTEELTAEAQEAYAVATQKLALEARRFEQAHLVREESEPHRLADRTCGLGEPELLGRLPRGNSATGNTTVALTDNDHRLFAENRRTQIDMRLAKIFRFGATRADVGVDIGNLLNTNYATGFEDTYQFGQPDGGTWRMEFGGYYLHQLVRTPDGWRSRELVEEHAGDLPEHVRARVLGEALDRLDELRPALLSPTAGVAYRVFLDPSWPPVTPESIRTCSVGVGRVIGCPRPGRSERLGAGWGPVRWRQRSVR